MPGASCKVTGKVNAWNTGLTEDITLTNTGSSTIDGWALAFTLPAGQSVTSAWNATIAPAGGQVTATNLSYNGTLAPGASASFGFQATHTGNTSFPTAFTLDHNPCAIA
ncbi:cellulose binding domain-containing protein [Streptomyces sp. YS-3]|uniref:cellulose binding domain-containing protein n=1 Tax=Streptomyces sp. YS-3 TaxID=3381352 RepID=UPI003862616E